MMQPYPRDLITHLRDAERRLLRRYCIRLRIDKITVDGRNALCSAAQVKRRFIWSAHPKERVVTLAHKAILPLHRLGLSPLISAFPLDQVHVFGPVKEDDPFEIRRALLQAGKEGLLPRGPPFESLTHPMRKQPSGRDLFIARFPKRRSSAIRQREHPDTLSQAPGCRSGRARTLSLCTRRWPCCALRWQRHQLHPLRGPSCCSLRPCLCRRGRLLLLSTSR